jgi:amidohydrolase
VQQVAQSMLPGDQLDFSAATMGAEDMAFMLQQVPGCYIFIGSSNSEKNLVAPHHSSLFDIDESILPKAAGLMVGSIMAFLQ